MRTMRAVADASTPVLEVRGLTRSFANLTALDRVDLEVAAGEVVALLGENGAGKSTLVEILAGRLRADSGELLLAGKAWTPATPRDAWRAGLAVVHQHFQLVEAFTVSENLDLAVGGRDVARRWAELERELEMSLPDAAATVSGLGVGERQWLEIGKALLGRPRALLLDEPTAVLTPREADRLFAVVRRLAARGAAVVFITHRLDEVRRLADRVVVLRRGRVVARLAGDAPTSVMAEAMTGRLPEPSPRPMIRRGALAARLVGVSLPPRLAPFDLELFAGEVAVLAGVDGNGQVAAAERLAGLRCGPGRVEVCGRVVIGPDPPAMRALGIVVVPADRTREAVVPSLSVAENLLLGRHRRPPVGGRWLDPGRVTAAAVELIERFAVAGRPDQRMDELSGGNQQKVAVARALAGGPRVVVAIHPTRGLDVAAQLQVHHHLLSAAAAGAAVLVVTSDLGEATALGDRVLVMSRGRVVGEGDRSTPAEVLGRWLGGEAA